MEKGKIVGAMFALLLLGFFAGYAVAQGSVTASLKLDTTTGSLVYDTTVFAPELNTSTLRLGGAKIYVDTTAGAPVLSLLDGIQIVRVNEFEIGGGTDRAHMHYSTVAPTGLHITVPVYASDFCIDGTATCLSTVGGGGGGTGGTTETYWKPSGSGIYYDGGMVEINSGSPLIVQNSGSVLGQQVAVYPDRIFVWATGATGVEINATAIKAPMPSDWDCNGDFCYKMGGSTWNPSIAVDDCIAMGAHLCSLAEYAHFICSLSNGYYWAADMQGNSVPGQVSNYARIHLNKTWGCGWDIDNVSSDGSNNPTYYCCKYVGAVYPQ